MHRRTLYARLFIILLTLVVAPATIPARAQTVVPAGTAQVSAYVAERLAAQSEPLPLWVVMRDQLDPATAVSAASVAAGGEAGRAARLTAVYTALVAQAESSQASLIAWLDAQDIPYTRHYLVNLIALKGNAALVAALAARPDVAAIVGDPQVAGTEVVAASPANWLRRITTGDTLMSVATPYGVELIGAPAVWAQGFRGQGIVIAGQDTGVDWQHDALRNRYRGWNGVTADHVYNWLDAWANSGGGCPLPGADPTEPCDDHGHGTHTMGTLVGSDAMTTYGVAPGARWMGCRNMLVGVGTPSSYLTCFEFFLAPYSTGGDPLRDGRPELAPHVVNNSWSCPPDEGCETDTLIAAVETLRDAGILIVASTGNRGASCATVRDPIAIYDASLSVAAHDAGGNLAPFSSRGPVTADGSGRLKPDLAAPGVGVWSTAPGNEYRFSSGTSMAAPHVAGAAALVWSAAPALLGNVELTEQVLLKSATPVFEADCTGGATPVSPNPLFGYGRLNVAAAVTLARAPWEVAVRVLDGATAPVQGATVRLTDQRTGYVYTATTGFTGVAYLSPVFHGDYGVGVRLGDAAGTLPELTLAADGEPVLYDWQGDGMAATVTAQPILVAPQFSVWLPWFFAP